MWLRPPARQARGSRSQDAGSRRRTLGAPRATRRPPLLAAALGAFAAAAEPAAAAARSFDFVADGGGVLEDTGLEVERHNAEVLSKLLQTRMRDGDSLVIGPSNASVHLMGGIEASGLSGVTLVLDAALIFSGDVRHWPTEEEEEGGGAGGGGGRVKNALSFSNMTSFTVTSSNGAFGGVIDGNGAHWWGVPLLGYLIRAENRPIALYMERCTDVLVENVKIVNPGYYGSRFSAVNNLEIAHSAVDARRGTDRSHESHRGIELTAFNTDGFDVSGSNIHIHDSWVWNQDDTFCVKDGAENILIENVQASGMGISIGSIGGNSTVRNVTFRNVHMHHTVKGIYMKFRGAGKVQDVLYENIFIQQPQRGPVGPIWIGPAQQSDSRNPCAAHPCSICWPSLPAWPFGAVCSGVAGGRYANITLRNVTVDQRGARGLWAAEEKYAGVLMAHPESPMEGVTFDDVVLRRDGSDAGEDAASAAAPGYLCEHVVAGVATGRTWPVPPCFEDRTAGAGSRRAGAMASPAMTARRPPAVAEEGQVAEKAEMLVVA